MAKTVHPDTNRSSDAKQKFQAINEAHEVLGDPESRAAYDASAYQQEPSQTKEDPPEPVTCSKCGKITAQPRYLVFRYVVSVFLATMRNPIQGIFCADCGKRAALRASAISAFAGWWGVPWGPIYTIAEIFRNAFGGFEPPGSREFLLWRNALSFLAQGNLRMSYALAREARKSSDEHLSSAAFRLMELLKSEGVENVPPLKDNWGSKTRAIPHLALLACLPIALILFVTLSPGTSSGGSSTPDWAVSSPPPTQAADSSASNGSAPPSDIQSAAPALTENTPAPVPVCAVQAVNGQVLTNNTNWSDEVNSLQIKNGSGGNAIIKIRDASSGLLLVSFFVANNQTAEYDEIPDGNYRIQYAFGDTLDESCSKFTALKGAGEFPDTESFSTEYTGTEIVHHTLSYTLYEIAGGNVRPNSIDQSAFDQP